MTSKTKSPPKVVTSGLWQIAVMVLLSLSLPRTAQGEPNEKDKAALESLMAEARKDVDEKVAKDPALKALAAKYPLVILHSRRLYGDDGSLYSFIDETSRRERQKYGVQVLFDNGGNERSFDVNTNVIQSNLAADLGGVDFTNDPDPKAVDINGEGQHTWLPDQIQAVEGDVYLERVRDREGTLFYVVFKLVAVDKGARYMAFLWRKLPGGKIVKPK